MVGLVAVTSCLAVAGCGSDDDSEEQGGASGAGTAGKAGSAGKGGATGTAGSGTGGTAGKAGGTAGTGGEDEEAGSGNTAGGGNTAGESSTAGTGGSTAGAGGSTAGTGGSTAGTGGSTAGSGGKGGSGGTGGSTAGSGGTGGATAGSGGKGGAGGSGGSTAGSGGTGGATAGSGGTGGAIAGSGGTGGATAGTGGTGGAAGSGGTGGSGGSACGGCAVITAPLTDATPRSAAAIFMGATNFTGVTVTVRACAVTGDAQSGFQVFAQTGTGTGPYYGNNSAAPYTNLANMTKCSAGWQTFNMAVATSGTFDATVVTGIVVGVERVFQGTGPYIESTVRIDSITFTGIAMGPYDFATSFTPLTQNAGTAPTWIP